MRTKLVTAMAAAGTVILMTAMGFLAPYWCLGNTDIARSGAVCGFLTGVLTSWVLVKVFARKGSPLVALGFLILGIGLFVIGSVLPLTETCVVCGRKASSKALYSSSGQPGFSMRSGVYCSRCATKGRVSSAELAFPTVVRLTVTVMSLAAALAFVVIAFSGIPKHHSHMAMTVVIGLALVSVCYCLYVYGFNMDEVLTPQGPLRSR